jgi:hypothetical protein
VVELIGLVRFPLGQNCAKGTGKIFLTSIPFIEFIDKNVLMSFMFIFPSLVFRSTEQEIFKSRKKANTKLGLRKLNWKILLLRALLLTFQYDGVFVVAEYFSYYFVGHQGRSVVFSLDFQLWDCQVEIKSQFHEVHIDMVDFKGTQIVHYRFRYLKFDSGIFEKL